MLRFMLNKTLTRFGDRFGYDVSYMQYMLRHDLSGFIKFTLFQTIAAHRKGMPTAPYFAAKIRTALWDDCGPCSQLTVDMALAAGVDAEEVSAIIAGNYDTLPEPTALVLRFTELSLAHDPSADALRDQIHALWGDQGLITLGLVISSCRVYPALKYSLGYGKSCNRIAVGNNSFPPPAAEISHA